MLFSSFIFILLFLPATLLGWHIASRVAGGRFVLGVLVVASLFFYGWWNPAYLALLLVSITGNYVLGLMLHQDQQSRIHLAAGITFNLGLLGYFKYAEFFSIGGTEYGSWRLEDVALPLAISFFTFQQIAYLVDVYRGESAERDPLRYVLFVSFFPQLIAGPIVHHKEMLPQFLGMGRTGVTSRNLAIGGSIFLLGLGKKVLIADSLGGFADPMFNAVTAGVDPTLFEAWGVTLAYTFQIYFDFSGYSDMAIGLGAMFGLRLPINFNSPYKATSIIDFWRRWHMTLSRFLRDYLYIPLGGSRRNVPGRYVNLMIVMLLGGLWHGAGWTFILWGGVHGIYLVINHG